MTGSQFRALALAFPETDEGSHMGHPDFRVRNKIFATLNTAETSGALKCDRASLDLLVRRDPETFRDAWKGAWLRVDLARVDEQEVRGLIEDAWLLVAPKSLATAYESQRAPRVDYRQLRADLDSVVDQGVDG